MKSLFLNLIFVCIFIVLSFSSKQTLAGEIYHRYGQDWVLSNSCKGSSNIHFFENDYRLTVFLNFDGAQLIQGGNSSQDNRTNLIEVPSLDFPAMNWAGFGGKETGLKKTVEEVKILYLKYAIEFVTVRPQSGDYTMVMVGGIGENVKQSGGGTVGIAPLDCENADKNDLAIVFGEKISNGPQGLAFVIAHELGHTFGLEHVTDPKDIMYPALNSETCCWENSPLEDGVGSCGRTSQDDHQILIDNVGPGPSDNIFPQVWLLRPGEGAILPSNFTFEVAATDDLRVHHVELYLDGEKKIEMEESPFVVSFTQVSDGEHVLRADVFDWNPNKESLQITVLVNSGCVKEGTCYVGPSKGCSVSGTPQTIFVFFFVVVGLLLGQKFRQRQRS